MDTNTIEARRVTQNNQEFLITVINVSTLQRYTKYTERIITEFDENNFPIYNSEIQRKTDSAKINLIADYLINDPQAMFPTNIVLAIPSFVIDDFTEKENLVTITLNPRVEEELRRDNGDVYISVIDGQHRLKGLELAIDTLANRIRHYEENEPESPKINLYRKTQENLLKFEVTVTFFIDPVLEYQASIFSTINRTQTKVSESLVYSLFGLTDKVSPQKSSLEITLALNSVRTSPFHNRIKLVGWTYKRGQSPPLTQAAMVKTLIRCISANAKESERDRFRQREELLRGITPELCFRRYYATNQDLNISKVLFAYFESIKNILKDDQGLSYWDLTSSPNILQTTVGYESLLNLLKLILTELDTKIAAKKIAEDVKFKVDSYTEYVKKIVGVNFADFERYPKTSVTKSILLNDMRGLVFS